MLRMITKYGDAELLWLTQPRTKNSFAPYARGSRVHCTIKERHNKCIALHFVTLSSGFLLPKLRQRNKVNTVTDMNENEAVTEDVVFVERFEDSHAFSNDDLGCH